MQTLATYQNYYRTCYITKISSCSEDIIRCNIKYYKIIADVVRKRLLLKLIKTKRKDFVRRFNPKFYLFDVNDIFNCSNESDIQLFVN